MANDREIEIRLGLDVQPLESDLDRAEGLMRRGVDRMGDIEPPRVTAQDAQLFVDEGYQHQPRNYPAPPEPPPLPPEFNPDEPSPIPNAQIFPPAPPVIPMGGSESAPNSPLGRIKDFLRSHLSGEPQDRDEERDDRERSDDLIAEEPTASEEAREERRTESDDLYAQQPGIQKGWEQLAQIKELAEKSPDAAERSAAGLHRRMAGLAADDPEQAEAAQELIDALKELTGEMRRSGDDDRETPGGLPVKLLQFMRQNAMFNTASQVGGHLQQGNLVSAGASALGGMIGTAFGGPAGMMAGSAIGGMAGGAIETLFSASRGAREHEQQITDTSARLGGFGGDLDALHVDRIAEMENWGYKPQETVGMFDALRETNVIDAIDDEAMRLVESLQGMARATGMSTDALTKFYSEYRAGGGEGSAQEFGEELISGAIESGFEGNLAQYAELLGSARQQVIHQGGQADEGDRGMASIQRMITALTGGEGRTDALLQSNMAMTQAAMSRMMSTGGAQAYSRDETAMMLAGIDRSEARSAFATPEQQAENAIARMDKVMGDFLGGGGLSALGMDEQGLRQAMEANPDFLMDKLSSANPDRNQAGQLQDLFIQSFQSQYGRAPDATDTQLFTQIGAESFMNPGLAPDSQIGGGQTITELMEEVGQTDGQKAREAEADRHIQAMRVFEEMKNVQTGIDNLLADGFEGIADLTDTIKSELPNLGDTLGDIAIALTHLANPIGSILDLIGRGVQFLLGGGDNTSVTLDTSNLATLPDVEEGIEGVGDDIEATSLSDAMGLGNLGDGVTLADMGIRMGETSELSDRFEGGNLFGFGNRLDDIEIPENGGEPPSSVSGGDERQPFNLTNNIEIQIPEGASPSDYQSAVERGVQTSSDDFLDRWNSSVFSERATVQPNH